MHYRLLPILAIFASAIFLGQGCQPILNQDSVSPPSLEAQGTDSNSVSPDSQATAPGSDIAEDNKDTISDPRTPIYEDFSSNKYQAAIANNEPIYLYFWATWCPTCRAQAPINEHVFNSYNGFVHAFRINILDNDVSAEEEAIAKQWNVTRQHTAVLIDKNGNEAKRTIGTRSETQLLNDLELITK